jgi:hypothetical protein
MTVPTDVASALRSGFNSLVSPFQTLDAAVEGTIAPSAFVPVGSTSELKLCRTASELTHTLQQQLGVSAELAALPIPLLRYRMEFQESLRTTVFSVSLVVKAQRVLQGFEVREPVLRLDPSSLRTKEALDEFVRRYGDCWVRRVHLGGEVLGVYTLYAQTREKSEELVQNISLSLPIEGVSVTPDLARILATLAQESSVNTTFQVKIFGTHQQPALATPDDLIAYVTNFGSQPLDEPVVLHTDTAGYEDLPGMWDVFQPVVTNRKLFCAAGGLLRKQQRLSELANQCHWVDKTLRLYGQASHPSLTKTTLAIEEAIAAINSFADSFRFSASTPLQPSSLPNLTFESPRLVPTLLTPLHLGGDDSRGDPFAFKDRARAIERRRRLARVVFNSGRLIDQIRFTYSQDPDVKSPEAPLQEWTEAHPGGIGRGKDSLPLELDLANGEQITTINANSGTGVDHLEFITNTQQRISGGRPSTGGRASRWSAGPQQVLLGFQGRAKTWLDSLDPVVADFSNALRWEPVNEDQDP